MGNRVYRLVGGKKKRPKEKENNILDKTEYGISWRQVGREKNAPNC